MDQDFRDRFTSASVWLKRGADGTAPPTLAASMASHLIVTAIIRYYEPPPPNEGQVAA